MTVYTVYIPEVHNRLVTVEASSVEEAKQLANLAIESGASDDDFIEYSHTKDIDDWDVIVETQKQEWQVITKKDLGV